MVISSTGFLKSSTEELFLPSLIHILFNIFENFERIFVQTALVGCFLKERILNKQERVLQLVHISGNIKAGRFSSRVEVFIREILSRLCGDPALNKRDRYKRNSKFMNN